MEKSSPSFKQALRITLKRNIVRLVLLVILLVIWAVVSQFRGGDHYSISPHTLAKLNLAQVKSPTQLLFTLNDPREKKQVDAEILALDTTGFPDSLKQQCSGELLKRLENQAVWMRSAYLGSKQQTIGKILVPQPDGVPADIGLAMIRSGCAFYCHRDDKYLSAADQQQYEEAQTEALTKRFGVWKDSSVKPSAECMSSSLGSAS